MTNYLDNVSDGQALALIDDKAAHSLQELYDLINTLGPEVFYMHVNDVSNDIAAWIRNVVGYNDLADKALAAPIREDFLALLSGTINELKNPPVQAAPAAELAPTVAAPAIAQAPQQAEQPAVQPASQPVAAPLDSVSPIPQTQAAASPVSPPEITSPPPTINISAPPSVAQDQVPAASDSIPSSAASPVAPVVGSSIGVDEKFDFEDIFTMLLSELEQEVLVLDI